MQKWRDRWHLRCAVSFTMPAGKSFSMNRQPIIRGMTRLIISLLLLAGFRPAGRAAQSAPVSINNEPHHRRLLYTDDLRMWDVTLAAGESTPPFLREYDVATVVIGAGTATVQNAGETGRIDNGGTRPYRALEIENVREMKQRPPFVITDLTLKAGDADTTHQHMGSTIVISISGTLEQDGIGGTDPVRIRQPGQWLSLPRFQAHTIRASGADAHIVEIEVR